MATSSCLENPMDGGAWWATVHGAAQSRTWLSDFTFTFFSLCLNHQYLKSLISCTLKRSYSGWPDVMVGNLYRQLDGEIQSSSGCFTVGLEDAVSLAEEGAGAPSRGIRGSADRLGRRRGQQGARPWEHLDSRPLGICAQARTPDYRAVKQWITPCVIICYRGNRNVFTN